MSTNATQCTAEDVAVCSNGMQVAKLLLWDLPGFNLPCSAGDAVVNFVLIILYGMMVYFASSMLTTAMDALESARFGTAACLGGCLMPLLGAAPDAMLIVATTTSQEKVEFGVKILANSNIVLLTIPWVIALFFGRRPLTYLEPADKAHHKHDRLRNKRKSSDADESDDDSDDEEVDSVVCCAKDPTPTSIAQYHSEPAAPCCSLDLTKAGTCRDRCTCGCATSKFWAMTGITVYPEVKDQAEMMLATLLPFVVVQVIVFVFSDNRIRSGVNVTAITVSDEENTGYLVAAVLCFCFIVYLVAMTFITGGARQKEYQGYIQERHMYIQQSQWIKFSAFYGQSGSPKDVLGALRDIAEVSINTPEADHLHNAADARTEPKRAQHHTPPEANGKVGSEEADDGSSVEMRVLDHANGDASHRPEAKSGDDVLAVSRLPSRRISAPGVLQRHISSVKSKRFTQVRSSSSGKYAVEMTINARYRNNAAGKRRRSSLPAGVGQKAPHSRSKSMILSRDLMRNAMKLKWIEKGDQWEAVREKEEALEALSERQNQIFHEFWAWCTPKSHLRTIFSVWKYNAKHHEFEKMRNAEAQSDDSESDESESAPRRVGCITCNSQSLKRWFIAQAFLKIVAALLLIAILAEPFVDAVANFGALTGVPDGIMAAVIPIVSNLNEVIASVLFTATAVKGKNSMMYTALYSAVSMNNSLALGMFLIAIYSNNIGLTGQFFSIPGSGCSDEVFFWDFSADVTAMLLTMVIVGGVGAFTVTYPLYTVWPVGLLFPLSIGVAIATQLGIDILPLQASLFGLLSVALVCMVLYISVVEIRFQCRQCAVAKRRQLEREQLRKRMRLSDPSAAAEEGKASAAGTPHDSADHEYREAFDFIDTDGDGDVAPQELYTLLNALGFQVRHKDIAKMISLIDSDGSGTINYDEFCRLVQAHSNSPERQEAIMKEAFHQFDADGNGVIRLRDLQRMAVRLGEVVEDDMLHAMLRDADVDADDGIDFEEFKKILIHSGLFEPMSASSTVSRKNSSSAGPLPPVVETSASQDDKQRDDEDSAEDKDDDSSTPSQSSNSETTTAAEQEASVPSTTEAAVETNTDTTGADS